MTSEQQESLKLASAALADRRGEINERSRAQHALVQISMAATASVVGFVLAQKADPRTLFVLPLISPPLGMLWVDHAVNIFNIGKFIETRIIPEFRVLQSGEAMMGYESVIREFEKRKFLRFALLGIPVLLLFAGAPAGALTYLALNGALDSGITTALWIGGIVLVAGFLAGWLWFVRLPFTE